jgi:Protein of unknown function (DUF2849)
MAFILAANDLLSGDVIYWSTIGWTRLINDALVADAAAHFEPVSKQELGKLHVVDPYAVEVSQTDGRIWPTKFREQVRAKGPSVRADLARI